MFDKNANYIHKCTYRYMANTKYKSVIVSSDFWNLGHFFFGRLKIVPVFPQYKVRKQLSNDHAAFMGEGNQPVQ